MLDSKTSSKAWYLDFGASNHIFGDSSVFSSLSRGSGTKIISARGHNHDVTGIMAICLSTNGIQKNSHVLYSSGITKNLISIGFLADRGFSLEFQKNKCIIKNSEGCYVGLASRNNVNGLYELQGDTLLGYCEVKASSPELYALNYVDSSKAAFGTED